MKRFGFSSYKQATQNKSSARRWDYIEEIIQESKYFIMSDFISDMVGKWKLEEKFQTPEKGWSLASLSKALNILVGFYEDECDANPTQSRWDYNFKRDYPHDYHVNVRKLHDNNYGIISLDMSIAEDLIKITRMYNRANASGNLHGRWVAKIRPLKFNGLRINKDRSYYKMYDSPRSKVNLHYKMVWEESFHCISNVRNIWREVCDGKPLYDSCGVWGLSENDLIKLSTLSPSMLKQACIYIYAYGTLNGKRYEANKTRFDHIWPVMPRKGESFGRYMRRMGGVMRHASCHQPKWGWTTGALRLLGKVSKIAAKVLVANSIPSGGYDKVRPCDINWNALREWQKSSKIEQSKVLGATPSWKHVMGRSPKFIANMESGKKHQFHIGNVGNPKEFIKAMQLWGNSGDYAQAVPIMHLIKLFGSVNEIKRLLDDPTSLVEVHDLGQFEYNGSWSTWKGFFQKNKQTLHRANACKAWEEKFQVLPRSAKELNTFALTLRYEGAVNSSLAEECAKLGVSTNTYKNYEALYERVKISEACPYVEVSESGYTFYKLAYNDPRGALLGLITNCCQHLNGAGSSCAVHGVTKSTSAFYVIEYKGNIIAQSWAWRGKKGELCFDSIEGLQGYNNEVISSLYQQAANKLLGKLGISKVLVGQTSYGLTSSIVRTLSLTTNQDSAKIIEECSYMDGRYQYVLVDSGNTEKFKKQNLPESITFTVDHNVLSDDSDVYCEYCNAQVHPDCEICPQCNRNIAEWV
jgi:hypothetical protein